MVNKGRYFVFLLLIVFVVSVSLIVRAELQKQTLGEATKRFLSPTQSSSPKLTPTRHISITELPQLSQRGVIYYEVVRVSDGDTFSVSIDGKKETIRAIGINTPETVDPRRPVECFGKEASEYAKKLLQNKRVRLEADPSQQNRDRYDRILRYAYTADGIFFNLKMIEDGYAYEYTYDTVYAYQKQFIEAEKKAREEKRGLWNPQTCNGNT